MIFQMFPQSTKSLPIHIMLSKDSEEVASVLYSELTLESLPKLLPLTLTLRVSSDDMYLQVIRKLAERTVRLS